MHQKHGVTGKSDPDFKPDPNAKMVFDPKKQVWRKITLKESTEKTDGPRRSDAVQ